MKFSIFFDAENVRHAEILASMMARVTRGHEVPLYNQYGEHLGTYCVLPGSKVSEVEKVG